MEENNMKPFCFLAIISFILSLISLPLYFSFMFIGFFPPFILILTSIILAIISIRRTSRKNLKGKELAIAALVIGIISLMIFLTSFMIFKVWSSASSNLQDSSEEINLAKTCLDVFISVEDVKPIDGGYEISLLLENEVDAEYVGAKVSFNSDQSSGQITDFGKFLEKGVAKTSFIETSVNDADSLKLIPYFIDEIEGKEFLCPQPQINLIN